MKNGNLTLLLSKMPLYLRVQALRLGGSYQELTYTSVGCWLCREVSTSARPAASCFTTTFTQCFQIQGHQKFRGKGKSEK